MSAADGVDDGPWWASGDDVLDDTHDPFAAHRRARAGQPWGAATPPPPARSLLEDAAEAAQLFARLAGARSGRATGDGTAAGHDPDVCRACPWCSLLRVVGQSRPEVVEHLGESLRHLGLAARALVDAAPSAPDGPADHRGGRPTGGAG